MNMSVSNSSVKKGETLVDTAMTLNAMHPDILVVRHHAAVGGAIDRGHVVGHRVHALSGVHVGDHRVVGRRLGLGTASRNGECCAGDQRTGQDLGNECTHVEAP
jgi:hypothetical protein